MQLLMSLGMKRVSCYLSATNRVAYGIRNKRRMLFASTYSATLSSSSSTTSSAAAAMSTQRTTSLRLYRILMRLTKSLQDPLPIQNPLDPHEYGKSRIFFIPDTTYPPEDDCAIEQQIYHLFWDLNQPDDVKPWMYTWRDIMTDGYELEWNVVTLSFPVFTLLWISKKELQHAIRLSYYKSNHHHHAAAAAATDDDQRATNAAADVVELQRVAIDAIRFLQEQVALQKQTSVSVDLERGLRVVATSSYVGRTQVGYRFIYRIRVENLLTTGITHPVQLLGRTWRIQDETPDGVPIGDSQRVNQPTGGAVGRMPILTPGECFEYTSGCELVTAHGRMGGWYHMADNVTLPKENPNKTSSPMMLAGDPMDHVTEDQKFILSVSPFPLNADR